MFSVAKEDLEILSKRKLNLIFILGGPGTGKGTQCVKIVNDFKYIHISTGDLIRAEIKAKSKIGEVCESYAQKGELVPFEIIINVLVKAIVSSKGNKFLIDGFPRAVDQALYLEKHIKEIKIILNVSANEEICKERILARGKESERVDDQNPETITRRLNEFSTKTQPVIDFYSKYGIVRNINSELEVNQVYETVKKQLCPAVYCIIGKKYSGKSTLANILAKRMGMKVIDFKEFVKDPQIAKKKDDDLFVVTSLAAKLREEDSTRVIIKDFPQKKEHYNLFVKNCKNFEKIFLLNINDELATERMYKMGYNNPRYIGCSELNKQIYEFNKKNDFIEYLRKQQVLVEIDVNNHLTLVTDEFKKKVQPHVLIIKPDYRDSDTQDFYEKLIDHFVKNEGFEILDVNQIKEENIARSTSLGREAEIFLENFETVPDWIVCDAIKPVIFRESKNKFILTNFPDSTNFIKTFEEKVCRVQKEILICTEVSLPIWQDSMELYFKKENRLQVYNKLELDDYSINDILGKNRDLTVVYGMPQSGKSTIVSHLKEKYDYTVLDLVHLITEFKTIKGKLEDPPAEPESVDLNKDEFILALRKKMQTIPLNTKICLENITNDLITELDHVKEVFDAVGRPRLLYEVFYHEDVLLDRWLKEQNVDLEQREEKRPEYLETIAKYKSIMDIIKSLSYQTRYVHTVYSVKKSMEDFDKIYGYNIICVKHDYDLDIDNHIYHLAGKNQFLYVNVPYLIYKEFYYNTSFAKDIEKTYHKKNLFGASNNIYYKYNPAHFTQDLVDQLIVNYITKNVKEIENTGNFVILSGYLNSDLFDNEEISLNLPLLEIKKLMNLGIIINNQ
jgi:adenylate kinase family enzyme